MFLRRALKFIQNKYIGYITQAPRLNSNFSSYLGRNALNTFMRFPQAKILIKPTIPKKKLMSTVSIRHFIEQTKDNIAETPSEGVELITGNFSYFTKYEANAIRKSLERGRTLVLLFDRDTIAVPANERAMWIREYFNYDKNLEVRVAYGPPTEKEGTENLYHSYIKKQLPPNIYVKNVCCGQFYSGSLAKFFGAKWHNEYDINSKNIDDLIKQNPSEYKEILTEQVVRRVISPFTSTISEEELKGLVEAEKTIIKADIHKLNQEHPNAHYFFKRVPWDTKALNTINLPIVIGSISNTLDKKNFSNPTNPQVFDMPIYMPGQGWKIPNEFIPYKNVIAKIIAAETLANSKISECNAYLTIDCGIVFPGGYARRQGLHVDGFLTKANARPDKEGIIWGDNTYIASDSKELQTEFYAGPFDLSKIDTNNPQAVLKEFEIQGCNMCYKQYDPYQIIKLTTNNVHAVHPNLTHQHIMRVFLKMTFSERLFNRGGNTINPNFNYRFMYVPREIGRNTQNFIGVPPAGYKDVDLREINYITQQFPDWVLPTLFLSSKKPDVIITAKPACEGEYLETIVDGDLVTKNVARNGDMKVSRTDGDSYFLGKNFNALYKPAGVDVYTPTERTLKTLRVARNISFLASWGTRQNIPAGGYLVQDEQGEIWGVHKKSFDATYQINSAEDKKPPKNNL